MDRFLLSTVNIRLDKKRILVFPLLLLSLFFSSVFLLTKIKNVSLENLILFNSPINYSFSLYILEIATFLLGTLVVFLLPGFLWISIFIKSRIKIAKLLAYSFVVSLILFIATTTIFKIFSSSGLRRVVFFSIVILLNLLALLSLSIRKTIVMIENLKVNKILLYLGVCLFLSALVFIWLFQEKIMWVSFDTNYSQEHVLSIPLGRQTDRIETFGMIESLKKHLLPYWDLEYRDKFGFSIIDPPLHRFIGLFLVLLFGESFSAISLNSIVIILVTLLFLWQSAHLGIKREKYIFAFLIIPLFFFSYIWLCLRNYYPDILINQIHLTCLLLFVQFYFLLRKDYSLFLVLSLLSFLTKYESGLFTILSLFFLWEVFKIDKRIIYKITRNYLFFISLYVFFIIGIGISQGDLSCYFETICLEKFIRFDYFGIMDNFFPVSNISVWDKFTTANTVEFLKCFLFGSSFFGILLFLPKKDKISNFYSLIGTVYFFLVIIAREKRPYFASPLICISIIIAIRMLILVKLKKLSIFTKISMQH
jgi:hypothetical protein